MKTAIFAVFLYFLASTLAKEKAGWYIIICRVKESRSRQPAQTKKIYIVVDEKFTTWYID